MRRGPSHVGLVVKALQVRLDCVEELDDRRRMIAVTTNCFAPCGTDITQLTNGNRKRLLG